MTKLGKRINLIVVCIILFAVVFWFAVFIKTGTFQKDYIIFEGFELTLSGPQPISAKTSPYVLLLFIFSFFFAGIHLFLEAIGKKKLSELFFGLIFISIASFFIILVKFSNIAVLLISILFVLAGLKIVYMSIFRKRCQEPFNK